MITVATVNEVLQYPCDEVSECDHCHNVDAVWIDVETEGAGDFAYCATCWQSFAKRKGGVV